MWWTLRIFTALVLVWMSLGPVGSAWAAPGNGNDVGQGDGHGQGLQTAPGQTGVAPSQAAGQSNASPGGNGNKSSDAHGNNPSAESNGADNAAASGASQDNSVTGNSGTIKISSDPLSSSSMANEPHPGCTFYILGYGFPTQTGTYSISPQPANGSGPAGTTTSRESPISYSSGASSPYSVLVQQSGNRFNLQIGPITDFASGQYKVFVNSDGTPGGAKQKVFRLDCPSAGAQGAVSVAGVQTGQSSNSTVAGESSPPGGESAQTGGTVASSPESSESGSAQANDTVAASPEIGQSGSAQPSGTETESSATTESGESAAAPQAFNAAQPNLTAAPEVQGVNVAGEQISVPAGVPVEINGETATVTGPAVVMVGSQPEELAPGEVMVLGVQAQQIAPNTGTAGLVATDFVYRVQPGDTLENVAYDYYGDGAYAWSIYQANPDALADWTSDGVVTPGVVLRLP
jgi:nucleoid-associated protein YgaU